MRNAKFEQKVESKFKNFQNRNIMYYGMGVPDRREDEFPIRNLPQVQPPNFIPIRKPPKEEEITVESVKAAREIITKAMKSDLKILKGYRDGVAVSLFKELKDLEHLTPEDQMEWCLKRADSVIDLIFGEE